MPPSELTTADLLSEAPSRRGLISGAGALGVLAGAAVLAGADALVPEAAEAAATDPVAHLLRRTTYGMNAAQIAAVSHQGTAKWLSDQMNPYVKVPDTAMDHLAPAGPG